MAIIYDGGKFIILEENYYYKVDNWVQIMEIMKSKW